MSSEVWKDIKGYEGRYQVSNLGRIKSLARIRKTKGGGYCWLPEKIMKTPLKKDTGRTKPYAEIRLRDGSPRDMPCKSFLVHRLVADTFIKILEPKYQVDHINGKHADNRVENLQILTTQEHGRIHPVIRTLPRNKHNGRFMKIGADTSLQQKNATTNKQTFHHWQLTNVTRQKYWGA